MTGHDPGAPIVVAPEPADSADAATCLRRYMAELDARFGHWSGCLAHWFAIVAWG